MSATTDSPFKFPWWCQTNGPWNRWRYCLNSNTNLQISFVFHSSYLVFRVSYTRHRFILLVHQLHQHIIHIQILCWIVQWVHLECCRHILRECQDGAFVVGIRWLDEITGGSRNLCVLVMECQLDSVLGDQEDDFCYVFICFFGWISMEAVNYFLYGNQR